MGMHSETCRMVTAKLLTGTARDCDCGVAYDDLETILADEEAENLKLSAAVVKLVKERARLREALKEMLLLVEDMMPGVRNIAMKDYARLNEAPIKARQALAGGEGE